MFDALLVPVDDSPESERIIPVAVAIARSTGVGIEFLTIDGLHSDAATTATYQQRLVAALPPPVVGRGTVLQGDGPVVALLLDAYRVRPTAVLTLATRAPGSLWQWLGGGSVGDEVVQETERPVVLAGPRCEATAASGLADHTTAALDGSPVDEQVMTAAVDWALAMGTPLSLFRAVVTPALPRAHEHAAEDVERCAVAARRHGLEVASHVVDAGDPGRAVLRHVSAAGGALVVGTHRRSFASRFVHGSSALWLVHRSPVPVLVAGFSAGLVPAEAAEGARATDRAAGGLSPCWTSTAPELMGWSPRRSIPV